MAFAWVRVENLLRNYYDCGEMIIGMAATRVTRDRDEFRRLAPPRTVEVALGTIDLVEAVVFFVSAIIVLTTSSEESPHNPMRFWIAGYAFQCIIHLAWLYVHQYPRRLSRSINTTSMSNLEYGKEIIFVCWWTLGCYWLLQSSRAGSAKSAPLITWLAGLFLFFDIFLFFCALTLASILALVLCCFLPLVYAFFYILGEQVNDALPPCPFCECSSIHKSTVRFV